MKLIKQLVTYYDISLPWIITDFSKMDLLHRSPFIGAVSPVMKQPSYV